MLYQVTFDTGFNMLVAKVEKRANINKYKENLNILIPKSNVEIVAF